jgi:hypothetical protein
MSQDVGMMNTTMELEPGDVVEVNAAGTLPFGLSDGFQVRLVRVLDSARRLVEREGREWVLEIGQIRARHFRRPSPDCRRDRKGPTMRETAPSQPARRAWSPPAIWNHRLAAGH